MTRIFPILLFSGLAWGQTISTIFGNISDVVSNDSINFRTCPSYVDSCIYICNDGISNPCHPDNLYPIAIDTSDSGESSVGSRYRIFFPWEYDGMTADKFIVTASWPCLSPTAVYASGNYAYWDISGNDECPGTVQGSIWYGDDCEDDDGNIGSENCQELVGRFCFVPGDTLNWSDRADQNISTDICDDCWMSAPAWSYYDSLLYSDSLLSPGTCDVYDHCHHSASDSTLCGVGYLDDTDTISVSINEKDYVFKDSLINNYPNPFNPITSIRYNLTTDSDVTIMIYDLMGRVVKSLVNSKQTVGFKSIQWNATNNKGQPVSAGIYLYTIQAGEFRQTKKMVLLK